MALKNSQGELHLPVKVSKIEVESSDGNPEPPPMTPLWIVLIVAVPLIAIGVIFRGRKVVSKLWRTDGRAQEQRSSPVGQESTELQ